jgi:AraC family transcriptional regulator
MLEEVGGYCEVRTEPNRSAPAASRHPNHMSLIPSGTTAWGHSDQISYMRDISLQFATTSIGAVLDNEADLERALTPRLMFSDPRLLNIGRLFAAECAAGEPCDALYGDSLTLALVVGLLRLDRTGGDTPARGGLAPWQLRRTVDCLEAHVARGVRLETLADLAQLSPSHFSRAFKTSTGVAPHRWLLQARVRKAQELLIEGRMPLAAVAVETGFVDQAHFTRVFSRATGESPGAWRRVRHG